MDVKNVIRNILPFSKNPVSEAKRRELVQGEAKASPDRDSNPQDPNHHEEAPKRGLTEEEILAAIAHLEALPGVKDNGLRIRLEKKNGIPVVYVEDPTGRVVRRIPESELSLMKSRLSDTKSTGKLLNKAM